MASQLKVNEIIKQSGSTLTIGQDGDTVSGPFTNVPAFSVKLSGNKSGIYNIWLHKGGANCHHKWFRRIYFRKFGEGKPNINTDKVITTTKARSQGFKPEANEQLVPVAPIDRKNRGYKS